MKRSAVRSGLLVNVTEVEERDLLLYRSVDNLIAIPRIEYKSRTKRSMSINDDIHGSPEAIHI